MDIIIAASIIIFVILLFSGIPAAFSFLGTVIFLVVTKGYDPSFLLPAGFKSQVSVTLLALPLFIALGYIVSGSDLAERLIKFMNIFVGRIRGGLGIIAVVSSCLFGAISGAAAASTVAIGTIMIPEMEKQGYPRGYSAALISSSAVLSTMIPPSIAMILYAFITEQSVAACFLATVGPGLLLTAMFSIANMFIIKNIPTADSIDKMPQKLNFKQTVKETLAKGKEALGIILLPILILGGIYGGIMTPTEAAAVSVVYTIFISIIIHRGMSIQKALLLLRSSACNTGVIMIMIFFASILSRIYVMERVPQQVSEILFKLSTNKIFLLLLINIFLLFTGMLMDELSGILMVVPILYPIIKTLGIHPIHFAAIVGTNLGMGLMTPPMAPMLYLGARVGKVKVDKMLRTSMVLVLFCSLPLCLLVTYWPELSLFIPRLFGFVR